MGNCDKCWGNPCLCGAGYKYLTPKQLAELIEVLKKLKPLGVEKPAAPTVEQASEDEKLEVQDSIDEVVADAIKAAGMRKFIMNVAFLQEDDRGLLIKSKLYETAIEGNGIIVMLRDTFYGGQRSKPFVQVVHSPTWLGLCVTYNRMMLDTGDKHHCFFEGIELIEKEDEQAYREIAMKLLHPMPNYMKKYPIYTFIRGS